MAEVIIKASVIQGDVISVTYNKKKDHLSIKVEKAKEQNIQEPEESL
jgi:hypothetical protein